MKLTSALWTAATPERPFALVFPTARVGEAPISTYYDDCEKKVANFEIANALLIYIG